MAIRDQGLEKAPLEMGLPRALYCGLEISVGLIR